jgi:hypothetical protein
MTTTNTIPIPVQAGPDSPAESSVELLNATASEQAFIESDENAVIKAADLIAKAVDDSASKYAKLGHEVLKIARKRKTAFPRWSKQDYDDLVNKMEMLVKLRVAIASVRIKDYVRAALFIEAVKPAVPGVEKLSYHVVANILLPALNFDPVELTGELRKEWHAWTLTTVARQIGDEPLTVRDLHESYAARKQEIAREALAKKDPEKALEAEKRSREAKARSERSASQTRILDSINKAMDDGFANVDDVLTVVAKTIEDRKEKMPAKFVGIDPSSLTTADCKTIADCLYTSGKLVEMKYLHARLDALIKTAENALIVTKAG